VHQHLDLPIEHYEARVRDRTFPNLDLRPTSFVVAPDMSVRYDSHVAQPKPPGDDDVPAALRPLVDQLATLGADERERIVRAARRSARAQRRGLSWSHLRSARGMVHIGGDAVKDTQALYDG
jgi:hypothetical protein